MTTTTSPAPIIPAAIPPPVSGNGTFADRIRLLIQRVGSATEIARRCGFSEGVVRSWRDGSTDPSRARCVTLARTLGISLIWLVAGEGGMQPDRDMWLGDDLPNSGWSMGHAAHSRLGVATNGSSESVDAMRLNSAIKILQSEFDLAGVPLVLAEHADLLATLYGALDPDGSHLDTAAMLGFNRRLAERLQRERQPA